MDTLDRLLVRDFLLTFLVVLAGTAFLFLGIDFLSHLWSFQLPLSRLFELYLYKIPATVQLFIPLASLMATLLVLTSMSRQNEVLALYASGVSTMRIFSTFVAMVAILSTFSFLTFDSVVPAFQKKQILIQKGLDPETDIGALSPKAGVWYRSRKLIYNVGRFSPEKNQLEDVSIYRIGPGFRLLEATYAKHGIFEKDDWTLSDVRTVNYTQGFPSLQTFETKRGLIPEKPQDLKTLEIHEETMRLKDLRKYIARNASFGLNTTEEQVHYHERVALVFSPLIFLLVAIPFALRPLKTYSAGKGVGLCFLVVFLYLLLFRLSLSVGKGGVLPPIASAWFANLAFLLFGLARWRRQLSN